MIEIRKGGLRSDYVMDVSRLEEIRAVFRSDETLMVGAAATYTEIMENREVQQHAPVLALAASQVGSRQIRNAGTLGGNVANASPAADSVPALLVHNARVNIQSAFGQRVERLEDVVTGPYGTNLGAGELIVGFILEPLPDYRSGFQRIARRRALSIARINAAAAARLDSDGKVGDVRLSLGSVTPRPCRMTPAEDHLLGKIPDNATIREAAAMVSREMVRLSGIRSSTEYKRPAVEGLVVKTLSDVFGSHAS